MTTRKREPKSTTDASASPVSADDLPRNTILQGDCLERLRALPSESVHAVVTDPPAGIAFMGAGWDKDKGGRKEWIAWLAEVMSECLRVLKPGGHAVVWSLPRTSHWTGMALEDAGFDIRDCLYHVFGSGFPKSANISKQLDRQVGAERERTHPIPIPRRNRNGTPALGGGWQDTPWETAPATAAAQQWDGWGTALKPSVECWWLARKPLARGMTVASNVLAYGTGALNIDATRVAVDPGGADRPRLGGNGAWHIARQPDGHTVSLPPATMASHAAGRWPPNSLWSHSSACRPAPAGTPPTHVKGASPEQRARPRRVGGQWSGVSTTPCGPQYGDEAVEAWDCAPGCPIALLDRQSGASRSSRISHVVATPHAGGHGKTMHSGWYGTAIAVGYGDSGGASRYFPTFHLNDGDDESDPATQRDFDANDARHTGTPDAPFFYCAKASRRERNEGCELLPRPTRQQDGDPENWDLSEGKVRARMTTQPQGNHHPTVKPQALLSWLCRLVTPPRGIILDPFGGSGSTGVAAIAEGFDYLLIERESEYVAIAEARCAHALAQRERTRKPSPVRASTTSRKRPRRTPATKRQAPTPLPLPLITEASA